MISLCARARAEGVLEGIQLARRELRKVIMEHAEVDRWALPDSALADGLEKAAFLVLTVEIKVGETS